MKKNIILIFGIVLFQSCYFGAGVVEINLPENYFLFGNNSIEETGIYFETGKHSSEIIIEKTVFTVGYNKDYIIAKSYNINLEPIFEDKNPQLTNNTDDDNLILYHILDLKDKSPKKSNGMTFKEYQMKRKELSLSEDLGFTIVIEDKK